MPIYIPLLLPLTVIALPLADLLLAVVRRTWAGQSPFAADKRHLHHRLLQVGHSHSRAVLIMYFWAALIAFGTVAFSVTNTGRTVVLTLAGLCLVGLVVLLTPRFRPRAPRAVQAFVPPRYRRRPVARTAAAPVAESTESTELTAESAGRTSSEPMAELSAEDKRLLGGVPKGSSAVTGRGHGNGRGHGER